MFDFALYPSLRDRGVLITGGASGIGAALVEQFVHQGARVAFLDVDDEGATVLIERLADARHPPLYLHCDLTDLDALETAIASARTQIGAIAVLINNAANDWRHELADIDESAFERNMAINLRHQIFATRAVIPDMHRLGGGSIICLGSTGWMRKNRGYPLYATAKAALRGFVNGMVRELGQQRIRINCLSPGWVITDKQARLWLDEEGLEQIKREQCLPGLLKANELARAALFLAADDSRMCTGQDLVIDGGWA
ncbi:MULTISPECIES: SDR family NAD(P)-dependent oxidoreductase [Pseudomonas]|uniref:3-oxoacyl-ACP reductase n=1 Tax=Pseudomonas chlororaphis TaxID=587753 RepID=A0A0D5Y0M2_9PSED|nr:MULTISPECIES: SDR family oxidoreductase [Pseudomonas]AKA24878.1 3-oxoacyl-ACP reductase [Pseudomonas chlororaphis]